MATPMNMQAAVLKAAGDLRYETVAVPSALGPQDTLVKVMAAGICGSDIGRVMVTGTYRFPTIPGHEFAGVVEAVGSGVGNVKPGDRVAIAPLLPCMKCDACHRGNYSLCDDYSFLGSRTDGGFAQYVKAPARNLVRFPDSIGFEEAATIESAAIILHGIHKINLRAGDSVAVIGIGALGYFAVRLAKLSGARPVIAVDIDESKLAMAREAGADICINASAADLHQQIRAATGGAGADVVLETAGNNAGRETAIHAARKQGTIVIYGSAHQDVVFKPATFERVLRNELHLVGSWNSYSVPFPGKEWFDLIRMIEAGELSARPLISHVRPLSDAPRIFKEIAERSFGGYSKVIFLPHGTPEPVEH
ncbi:galactitol-1-phosphate 5-dehydrogenase [Variovorax robiniae]|uniref:Galactitol-1-phosphate 5-dehydrogenase n=1 Tax=Variovorax robiniae TaxID=1836199 RepID=A0ABU8XGD0_9BURK